MRLTYAAVVLATLVMITSCEQDKAENKNVSSVSESAPESVEGLYISDADFDSKVIDSKGVVLVDFFATWCPPCKMQGPIIESLASKYAGKANIYKLDVDKNPKKSSEYGIRSIPTLIFFKGGQKVETLMGLQSENTLTGKIDNLLNN